MLASLQKREIKAKSSISLPSISRNGVKMISEKSPARYPEVCDDLMALLFVHAGFYQIAQFPCGSLRAESPLIFLEKPTARCAVFKED